MDKQKDTSCFRKETQPHETLILSKLIDKYTLNRAEIATVLVALAMWTLKFVKVNQREQPGKRGRTSHTMKLRSLERCAFDHKFWNRPVKWGRNPRGRPTFR